LPVTPGKETGLVFDIQGYSLHDGPGIRVLIFLKGCPLRCIWCSNPESQSHEIEIMFDALRCQGCGQCVDVCATEAITRDASGQMGYAAERCNLCGSCVEICPHKARKLVGREMTVEEVMAEVEREMPFFRRSGGGVTLGGGEPLFQPEFAHAVLRACTEQNIHTAIETCGHTQWETLKDLAGVTDLFLYDLKHMDPSRHRLLTGADNELVLNNLRRLSALHSEIIVRYPLVPTCNDSETDIRALIRFVNELDNINKIELLPYHRLGESKYAMLTRRYPLEGLETSPRDRIDSVVDTIRSSGLECELTH